MSNFEEKFRNWQERMNKKSDKEKHIYAMTVALFCAAIVSFFVISNWYFIISGNEIKSSIFTDIENIYTEQKDNFFRSKNSLLEESRQIVEILNPATQSQIDEATTTATSTEPKVEIVQ